MKPSNLRHQNQRLILDYFQQMDHGSKAAIADSCGLSKPTAGKIIDELLAATVLVPVTAHDEQQGATGRPSQQLGLARDSARFALIEVAVNALHCHLVSVSGKEIKTQSFAAPKDETEFLSCIKSWWKDQVAENTIWACAMAMTGVVDEKNNRVLKSPNIAWTEGREWFSQLQRIIAVPICMVQEIRALAVAHLHGDRSTVDAESFLYVYCDQGLGGALVIDRNIFGGASALSAELGHTPIAGNQRPCGCGNTGCLETIVDSKGLCETFAVKTWDECLVAMNNDPQRMHEALDHLARHIAAAVNVSGVHTVVLGEKINKYPAVLKTYLEDAISAACLWSQFGEMQFEYATCTLRRGLVAHLWDQFLATTVDWNHPCQMQH